MSLFLPRPLTPPLTRAEILALEDCTPIIMAHSHSKLARRYNLGFGAGSRRYAVTKDGETVDYLDTSTHVWVDSAVTAAALETAPLGKKV